MSFQSFFVLVVLLLVVAPKQFVALAGPLIDQLMPIAHKGLELAIIVAVIMFLLSRFK